MPLVIGVRSLSESCVKYITENLDHWYNKPVSEVMHVINPELAKTPFDELPIIVLKKVINVLEKNVGYVKRKYFDLLLSPQLDNLNLNNQKEKDVGNLLYHASIKCMHLKGLQLRGQTNVENYMVFFLPKFELLQELDVSHSTVGDNCLQLLGAFCKNLKDLNVSDCINITNEGIKGLCVSVDNYGRENLRLGQCKLIEKLATNGTNITNAGKKILLENLHNMKIWDAAHVGLLSKMFKSDPFLLKEHRKYSFIQLELKRNTYFGVNSLKLGVSLCPSLTKITINTADGLMDSELLSLLSLKNLGVLEIIGFDDEQKKNGITFFGGVIPLLKCFGCSLEALGLSHLHNVDIPLVTQLCPNLRFLSLEGNWSYSAAEEREEERNLSQSNRTDVLILLFLEKLCLAVPEVRHGHVDEEINCAHPIPSGIIDTLLSSPILTDVIIFGCENLTDEILHKADRIHHFKHLVYLKILFCSSVTKKGIDVFFTNRNPLRKIELENCLQLTNENARYWRRRKREENWLLDITFRELDLSNESESVSDLSLASDSDEWSNEWGGESEDYYESDSSDFDSLKEWADTDHVDVKNL